MRTTSVSSVWHFSVVSTSIVPMNSVLVSACPRGLKEGEDSGTLSQRRERVRGKQKWTSSGRFQGSSNSSGAVMKTGPTVGYYFNRRVESYMSVPFYPVHQSSSESVATPA